MYKIYDSSLGLIDTILKINNCNKEDLDVSNFQVDYSFKAINDFKEVLEENKNRKFFILGDYDFDGISSTVIIKSLLDKLKINNNYYIPSRSKDGYGINREIIDRCLQYDFDCLLLLDNGIANIEDIEYAKSHGLKVFIIDHHEYNNLPNADCIIHPNLLNKEYEDACTCGLANLLSMSYEYDDYNVVLAGIASLADMVKVFNYNRYLIKKALELLNSKSFGKINFLSKKKIYTYEDLTYSVIPKVNAVSRLDYNPNYLVKYFLDNSASSYEYGSLIDSINDERKKCSSSMIDKCNELLNYDDDFLLVIDKSFKEGLCGLVSTRITANYHKPSLVLSYKEGIYKGSGRGSEGFNLFDYLSPIKDIFITFGGHEGAIGLSFQEDKLPILLKYIKEHKIIINNEFIPVISCDVDEISLKMINDLDILKPFGTGLKEPLYLIDKFCFKECKLVSNKYPKYIINDNFEAILFNLDLQKENINRIYGKISKDHYSNKVSMTIEDIE